MHILATNLNEGCLCSFSREGLVAGLARSRDTCSASRPGSHRVAATVPMAVTASSAYPGICPPLEVSGGDSGAVTGEFGRQAFTDGGVIDNLGVRMFHFLERPLLAESPLCADDFFDLPATLAVLRGAAHSGEETPLHRLWRVLTVPIDGHDLLPPMSAEKAQSVPPADSDETVMSNLWTAMRRYQFYHDPLFAHLKPTDPAAESLLRTARSGVRVLDMAERIWMNRHLLEAAFREVTGHPCFRRVRSVLDGVLVSDVGRPIKVQANRRAGGLISTAMRASDILMDRVGQLERETFYDAPGFVFAQVTDVVEPAEDVTALHPEIQRQTANIRTDLDRFSSLEISSLIRHGYCVGRKACRTQPELFGANLPTDAPWDPIPPSNAVATSPPPTKVVRPEGPPPHPRHRGPV